MARPSQGLPPFDPNDRGLNSDPWPVYRRYRAQDPVHWGTSVNPQLDGAWYVFGFEDCKNILLNPAFPINPASVGMEENFPPAFKPAVEIFDQWLGATDAPDHAALRKLMNQGFTAKSIQAMVPRIEELAQHLVDEALGIDGGQFNFVDTVAFPLPIIVICELLGVPTSDRMMFRDLSQQFLAAVHKPGDEVLATAGSAAAVAMLEYFTDLTADRRRSPRDDFVSLVVTAAGRGEVSLAERKLAAMTMELVVGGHETTVNGLSWGLLGLLEHRDQYEMLCSDPDSLVAGAVEELLRWSSPVKRPRNRWSTEEIEFGGRRIKRGDAVHVMVASANRDETRFANPDKIDITRHEGAHLAFGHGAHFCLGAPLARIELRAAFRSLANLAPGLDVDLARLTWRDNAVLSGPGQLWVTTG